MMTFSMVYPMRQSRKAVMMTESTIWKILLIQNSSRRSRNSSRTKAAWKTGLRKELQPGTDEDRTDGWTEDEELGSDSGGEELAATADEAEEAQGRDDGSDGQTSEAETEDDADLSGWIESQYGKEPANLSQHLSKYELLARNKRRPPSERKIEASSGHWRKKIGRRLRAGLEFEGRHRT
eukprot:jgi/Botrbrau1/21406/Bobra.0216s0025.1